MSYNTYSKRIVTGAITVKKTESADLHRNKSKKNSGNVDYLLQYKK